VNRIRTTAEAERRLFGVTPPIPIYSGYSSPYARIYNWGRCSLGLMCVVHHKITILRSKCCLRVQTSLRNLLDFFLQISCLLHNFERKKLFIFFMNRPNNLKYGPSKTEVRISRCMVNISLGNGSRCRQSYICVLPKDVSDA